MIFDTFLELITEKVQESALARVIRSSFRVYDERAFKILILDIILDLSLSCCFVCLLLLLLPFLPDLLETDLQAPDL